MGDDWLRSVVENSSEIVTVVDPDGTLRYANPAFGRTLGYEPGEAVGTMNVLDHVHPDDLPHVLEETEEALAEGGVATNKAEYRFRHADGSWRWMESVGTYLLDDPNLGGVVVTSRDATGRKEAEEALRESEERFRAQYENLPVPTYTWRRVEDDFVLVDHNDAARQFTCDHIENLLCSRATELLSERPVLLKMIGRCFTERTTLRREMPCRMLRTAEERRFVATCVFVPPELVMVHTEDVTERARAEGQLRFQSQLLGAVGEAVIALDADRKVVYWNRAAEEMYGFSAEEVDRRLMDRVVPGDLRTHAEEIMAGVRSGLGWKGEFVVRRRDGTPLTVEATNTPVFGEDGEQVGVVGVLRDVTERKRVDEALRESEAEIFSVLDSITDAFFSLDRDWRFVYVNPQAQDLFSKPREDLVGERIWEDPTFYPEYRRAVEEGLTVEFEALYPPSGLWYSVRAYPSALGLSVYLQDITERKKAEAALKESEKRFRSQSRELALLHKVRSAVAQELDAPGVLYRAVEAVAETYGYTQVSSYLLEGEDLVLQHQVGYDEVIERIPLTEGVCGRVVRKGEPVLVEDVLSDPGFLGAIEGITSEIGVPLFDEGEAVGILNVESTGGVKLTHDDLGLMVAVGEHVGVALSRARLHDRVRRSEERFRALTQHSSDLVTLLGATGVILYQSPAVERVLGYSPDELLGKNAFDHVHPNDLVRVEMAFAEGLKDPGRRPSVEYRFRHKDGAWRWLESAGTNLIREPAVTAYVINSRDVTERKEAGERLREAEERYRTLVERIPAVTYVDPVDDPDESLYTSPQIEEMLGYTPEEWRTNKLWPKRLHPDDRERILAADERFEAEDEPFKEEYRLLARDGSVVWVREEAVLIKDGEGKPLYWQGVFYDLTERKNLEERLEHRASHDYLTNLPNRRLFGDRLGQALRRIMRKQNGVAVLFMDLDGFKVVNDSLGHNVGDLLLTVVAQRLRRCLRPEDTLARFGGDEFVVLIEDVDDPEEAVRVAERITKELRYPFTLDGRELYVAASIGISLGDARTHDPDVLLREADTAMYRAKEAGGGGFGVFDPTMHERALGRLELENDLRRAIEEGEFVVHYQPIVSLETGEAWGLEALVRWQHPERGLLNPDEFVSIAEESGLVVPMGVAVLEAACRKGREWRGKHPHVPALVVSVNLSARQLARPDLAETVEGVLGRSGFDGSCLALDVTETVYVKALEGNTRSLDRLRGVGVRISIDDFGTGYSSLSYLKRLPADAIKIDRSFVKGLGEDLGDTAIVRMVVELAHTLGMEVVAEGVETEDQAALLAEMGCDFAQGYYFSKPLPPEEVPGFLSG